MNNILLVEDDIHIQTVNKNILEDEGGYSVCLAMNLAEARSAIEKTLPDLIVLDIMLPDGSGLNFLTELRESGCGIPILLLTALGETKNKVAGLRAGSDDYLAKPYNYDELLARIETILRRGARQAEPSLKFGTLSIDTENGTALLNNADLNLSRAEFGLLRLLARNKDQAMSAESLYEAVWKQKMGDDSRALISAASRLRKKLAGSGYTITFIRNQGYRFEQEI